MGAAGHAADHLPDSTAQYGDSAYWNKRFQTEEQYEWCKDYSHFSHFITPQLLLSDRILVLGCGNSSLTQELHRDGFKHLTSTDLSPVVIERMQAKSAAANQGDIKWQVADMLNLQYESGSFDAVIEKGTLDVLFADNDDPFNPKQEIKCRVLQMLQETHRVLASNGRFISVTFAQPHFRKPFLLDAPFTWSVKVSAFGEGFHYFVYVMHKNMRTAQEQPVPFGWPTRASGEAPSGILHDSMQHDHMEQEDYLFSINL